VDALALPPLRARCAAARAQGALFPRIPYLRDEHEVGARRNRLPVQAPCANFLTAVYPGGLQKGELAHEPGVHQHRHAFAAKDKKLPLKTSKKIVYCCKNLYFYLISYVMYNLIF